MQMRPDPLQPLLCHCRTLRCCVRLQRKHEEEERGGWPTAGAQPAWWRSSGVCSRAWELNRDTCSMTPNGKSRCALPRHGADEVHGGGTQATYESRDNFLVSLAARE